jgi:VWFA-related protein
VPPFRGGTDLVRLDVSVLDKDGMPIQGLTAADFSILEDGAPQPVVAFAAVDLPTWSRDAAPWVREVAPDVASNRADARRAVVVVLDDAGAQFDPGVSRTARAIATAAVESLGPSDVGAVVYTCNRRAGQEFTIDRPKLRAAIDRFVPVVTASVVSQGGFRAETPTRGLRIPSGNPGPSGVCTSGLFDAVRNAAEVLGAWPDVRKLLVLVTSGRMPREGSDFDQMHDDLKRTLTALQEANVSVYEFDPRGLEVGRLRTDLGLYADNATGGRIITDTNEPEKFMPEVYRENSSYYLLGFRPAPNPDGRYRRLKVHVNRPGVTVRARTGYFAPTARAPKPKDRPADPLERALSLGLPTGDLPLSLTVVPFSTSEKPGEALAVLAGVGPLTGTTGGAELEFVAVAFDEEWKEVARNTQRIGLSATADASHASEVGMRLNVKPGRYELRVAMRDAAADRTGSVYASVTVPDFSREAVALSGIFVTRDRGGASILENLAAEVPARSTTERAFERERPAALAVSVYQLAARSPSPVRIATTIRDEGGGVVFSSESVLEPAAFDGRRQARHSVDLPLKELAAGQYLVTIDAKTTDRSARRELRFAVRESK